MASLKIFCSYAQGCVMFAMLLIAASLMGCDQLRDDGSLPWSSKPPVVKNVLARGLDATQLDLWTLKDIYYTSIFENMPEDCNIEINCPRSELKESKEFESTKAFKESFTSSFGIGVEADWKGLGGKLDVGTNDNSGGTHSTYEKSNWWKVSKIGKCGQLKMGCVRNSSYFSPSARLALDDLLEEDKSLGGTDDRETMLRWYEGFVQPFGSHIIKAVAHGAAIQALHSLDKSCEAGERCEGVNVGFHFGFVRSTFEDFDGSADLDLDHEQKKCEESNACIKDAKTKCATLGGGTGSLDLCGSEVSSSDIAQFLQNSDSTNDSSSVISMQLMPMHSVLAFQGYPAEVRKKVEQTMEFMTCEEPLGTWTRNNEGNGEHFCKCTLQCKNGGVLNEQTCTCDCPGSNDFHGWKGRDCSESYGKCKCGKAEGMGTMDKKCCKTGNKCGSVSQKEKTCKDTEVCCNRLEGSHCCPLGTACGKFRGLGKNPIFTCVPN